MKAVYNEVLMPSLSFFLRGKKVISITGAGGKTSLMVALGNYFENRGEITLLTTTTHLSSEIDYGSADLFVESDTNGKFKSPGIDAIINKLPNYDRVIIEADGSRRLPLKFHTSRDPVVIDNTDSTLSVVGLSSLGCEIKDVMFGQEEYYKETNDTNKVVTLDTIKRLILSKNGVLKDAKGKSSFIVLNQADLLSPKDVEDVNKLMFELQKNYLLVSLKELKLYSGVLF